MCICLSGPTYDGRIKPDIVSPGDFIMSSYSCSTEQQQAAYRFSQDLNANQSEYTGGYTEAGRSDRLAAFASKFRSCAVHQMSGTSMATPVSR